ncbi:probable E3 ubiquitin-protein ligase TRIML2 [Sciurus carolinensis]|uniref:probable E3 ubiquitin-protein ligase TRIML2 n=1 Tax=Sciurus carolinensis TaxID=30640 RepID=UPI001FB20511|nr:probable E3 ubiquitin-protein ligase TRIML2 [Sciurus carolinensis]
MSKRLRPHLQHNITEDVYCETHLEPSQLFCDNDQVTLCHKCFQSQEHKYHMVFGIQEAAENYRKLFQEILSTLKMKLDVAKVILTEEQERMLVIQEEEQKFKTMIESEYRMQFRLLSEENELNFLRLHGYKCDLNVREASQNQLKRFATELEEKYQETLQRLHYLGRENMNKLKASEVKVSEQLCSLQSIIAELENKCSESAVALLQNARHYLERSESLLLQCLKPACLTDLSSCQVRGMSQMLTSLQRHISLDPEAAHPCLVLSENLRSVRFGNIQQGVPCHPGRLDFSATVMGLESFTSGRHYWEVDVEKATKWQLGVSEESACRKGSMPEASKVLLTGSMMGTDYTFWVFPPLKRICWRKQMPKVGVFLDYEYGQISFYNVTEQSLVYNFSSLTFHGALRPIFSLCIPNGDLNSDSLTISLPHVPS